MLMSNNSAASKNFHTHTSTHTHKQTHTAPSFHAHLPASDLASLTATI